MSIPSLSETSTRSRRFGEKERAYLSKLAACMQQTVEPETVRMWLEKAQADGLDPRILYQAAIEQRLPQWKTPPPFEAVAPTLPSRDSNSEIPHPPILPKPDSTERNVPPQIEPS
ncbi:MAG: hypothetical protein LDL14_02795 [Nitrospira sp.]|nr:hypothetical protein [Nitrospira sp.]